MNDVQMTGRVLRVKSRSLSSSMHLKRVDLMALNEEGMATDRQYDAALMCVLSR